MQDRSSCSQASPVQGRLPFSGAPIKLLVGLRTARTQLPNPQVGSRLDSLVHSFCMLESQALQICSHP